MACGQTVTLGTLLHRGRAGGDSSYEDEHIPAEGVSFSKLSPPGGRSRHTAAERVGIARRSVSNIKPEKNPPPPPRPSLSPFLRAVVPRSVSLNSLPRLLLDDARKFQSGGFPLRGRYSALPSLPPPLPRAGRRTAIIGHEVHCRRCVSSPREEVPAVQCRSAVP